MDIKDFQTLVDWIIENQGEEVAHNWLWSCTPYPCGHPSNEQIEEGLSLAVGEITINSLMSKCELEMFQALDEYNKRNSPTM